MERKAKKRKAAAVVKALAPIMAVALFAIACGAVLAYMTAKDARSNSVSIGSNESVIEEEFVPETMKKGENTFRKEVSVKNTGNVPCYTRVFLAFSDSDIGERSQLSSNGISFYDEAAFRQHLPEGWVYREDDGYYYYTKILEPGKSTGNLIHSVRTSFETEEQVDGFDVIVYEETAQIKNTLGEAYGADGYLACWE